MKAADLHTLAEFHRWANLRILRAAAGLTTEQLHAPDKLSHGSLFQTLLHLVDVDWSWRLACQTGAMPVEYLTTEQMPDLPALRKFWLAETAALLAYIDSLSDAQVEETATYTRPRFQPRHRTRWHLLLHIFNHSAHHRGEIGHYLTACGRSPGDLDFLNAVSS